MSRRFKFFLLATLTLLAIAAVYSIPHIPQTAAYHRFCDSRRLWGIPNFANVVSNLPFVIIGIAGLVSLGRRGVGRPVNIAYFFLFSGIVFTGFGSAYYHWSPDNDTLVFDRLPMTIVFMSLLAAIAGEAIGPRAAALALGPLLVIGTFSVVWWHYTESRDSGDLRLYVLVQYYPMLLIPGILLLFPSAAGIRGWPALLWAFGWYGIAKVADRLDRPIYSMLGVSGHTIKHLAAAVSTWWLLKRFRLLHTTAKPHDLPGASTGCNQAA